MLAIVALGFAIHSLDIVRAQSVDRNSGILLELNKLDALESGCQMTFVVSSKISKNVDRLAYEVVLFDKESLVDRMTVFDFKDLAAGKTKVRQFNLKGTDCSKLGRLLINGNSSCTGKEVDAQSCIKLLSTSNKTDIDFGN